MGEPRRIQLSRRRGWRLPASARKVDRSTRWGNPFGLTQVFHTFDQRGFPAPCIAFRGVPGIDRSLDLYLGWLVAKLTAEPDFLKPLKGRDLACWCKLDDPCHADILLRLANGMGDFANG